MDIVDLLIVGLTTIYIVTFFINHLKGK